MLFLEKKFVMCEYTPFKDPIPGLFTTAASIFHGL